MKTLTFFSNYFNHHQEALCNAFYSLLGDGFTFVETEPMEEFRSEMGWGREAPSYVLKSYASDENYDKALDLGLNSDVVIMGTAPELFIEERLERNRLTFRYSERPLKEGRIKVLIPRLAKKFYHNHYRNRNKELYILAAGAYCASDYRFLRSYLGKCYKFGYFPEGEKLSYEKLRRLKDRNRIPRILWAGRFIKLKRPDLFLKAAKKCRDEGFDFQIIFVGDGKEEKKIKRLVKSFHLCDRTLFKGFLSPEETREEMERADIFVMTSNHLEGWGSVIYEALSAGCAVIATHVAGATPFLIQSGHNGFIFQSGSLDSLTGRLRTLLQDRNLMKQMGRRAYFNMKERWNPRVAAVRFIELSEALLKGEKKNFASGPLSRAPYILQKNYQDRP